MRVVVITGTSSGIGLATTLRFAQRGDRVFATMRDLAAADRLRAAADAAGIDADRIELERIDVTADASVSDGVQRVLARAGHIDVLVNNAGISVSESVEYASIEQARRIFEVNYFGAVRMIRAVLPGMRERRVGRIVNVSSISGRVCTAMLGHYAASKHALEAMSEALAIEVAQLGVRVALVEPGTTATPMFTRRTGLRPIDPDSPYMRHIEFLYGMFASALKEPLQADEVAAVIEQAASSEAPAFRYLMGRDAEALVRARESSDDHTWIEQNQLDDAGFRSWLASRTDSVAEDRSQHQRSSEWETRSSDD